MKYQRHRLYRLTMPKIKGVKDVRRSGVVGIKVDCRSRGQGLIPTRCCDSLTSEYTFTKADPCHVR